MKSYPTRRAYEHAIGYVVDHWNVVHQRFCSECGEQTALLGVDEKRWDRLCSHCRSWKHGILGWFLSLFGWEIRRNKKC